MKIRILALFIRAYIHCKSFSDFESYEIRITKNYIRLLLTFNVSRRYEVLFQFNNGVKFWFIETRNYKPYLDSVFTSISGLKDQLKFKNII